MEVRPKIVGHPPDTDQQELSAHWMDKYGADLSRLSDRSSSLQAQRRELPAKKGPNDFTDDFCLLIQRYAETTQTKQCVPLFNIRGAHSWDEVTQAANLAEKEYLKNAKGPKGSIRRIFRWTGDNARVINPWVNLLPNDQYFSVLCGGLKLILGIAARRSEQREDILDTFKKVPETVLRTQRYHELVPDDKVLRDCAFALYLALLEMIVGMIGSLVGKSLLTKIKDGFTGSLSDRPLEEIKKRYRKSEHDLQERLDYLRMSMDVSTNAAVERIEPTVVQTNHTVLETHRFAIGLASQTSDIHTQVDKMTKDVEDLQLQMAKQLEANYSISQIEGYTKATNELVSGLRQELRHVEWRNNQQTIQFQPEIRNMRLLGESHSDSQSRVQNKWLQELVAIDLHTITRDLEFMAQQGPHINSLSQVQSQQLLSNPRFHHWIRSNKSNVLLLDGNRGSNAMSRCSPMSSLCAALMSGLAQQGRAHIAYFSCGAHSTSGDPIGGPIGLVRCLIAQLLALREFDIDFIRFGLWNEQFQHDKLVALCGVFRELVTQLPGTTLFCIIDGISLFETDRWQGQMQTLMKSLILLARDEIYGAVFKLLLTGPGISKDAKAIVPPQYCINIAEDGVEDDVRAMTNHKFPRETYQTGPSRRMGYSNRFLVHDSDAFKDDDNFLDHGCE